MIRFVRPFAALLAGLGFAACASATTTTIDYGDLWYNAPAESQSGWGVNIAHQGNILFVSLFVYGSDGTPRWYVASDVVPTGAVNTFSGALFNIPTGTFFGVRHDDLHRQQCAGHEEHRAPDLGR